MRPSLKLKLKSIYLLSNPGLHELPDKEHAEMMDDMQDFLNMIEPKPASMDSSMQAGHGQ